MKSTTFGRSGCSVLPEVFVTSTSVGGRPGAATSDVESAVSALRLRGVPQGVSQASRWFGVAGLEKTKLCNMLKNVKVSLLKMYEIDYFWSIWLLGCFRRRL